MKGQKTIRDAFFDRLYEFARQDRDVIIVSADMGAPSLDKFRRDLSNQYINVGIAEHNAVAVAVGLALCGKKVFVYAIEPFVSSRVHEFIKVDVSLMKVPITIVGVGAGFSYDDSGPTHHTTEDISIMRPFPNMEILNPSDSVMAAAFADRAYKSDKPIYIRLDRETQPVKYDNSASFEEGFIELRSGDNICIVATGNFVSNALHLHKKLSDSGVKIGVVDLFRLKPINEDNLIKCLSKYSHVISWEEHLLAGGIGSILSEIIVDNNSNIKLKRIGIKDKYCYYYGGRKNIQKKTNIGDDEVIEEIKKIISVKKIHKVKMV